MIRGISYTRPFTIKVGGTPTDADAAPTASLLINGTDPGTVVTIASVTGTGKYTATFTPPVAGQEVCVYVQATIDGAPQELRLTCGISRGQDDDTLYRDNAAWVDVNGTAGTTFGEDVTYDNPGTLDAALTVADAQGIDHIKFKSDALSVNIASDTTITNKLVVGSNSSLLNTRYHIVGTVASVLNLGGTSFRNVGVDLSLAGMTVAGPGIVSFQDCCVNTLDNPGNNVDMRFERCALKGAFTGRSIQAHNIVADDAMTLLASGSGAKSLIYDSVFNAGLALTVGSSSGTVTLGDCSGDIAVTFVTSDDDSIINIIGGAGNITLQPALLGALNSTASPVLNVYGRNPECLTDNSGGDILINFFDTRDGASPVEVYDYFTASTRPDAFHADVSALATQTSVNALPQNNDVNVVSVTGTAVTDVTDFHATSFDTTALVNAIWSATSRTLTDTSGFELSVAERTAIATAVEQSILNEGDGQAVVNAIVGAINNQNVDEIALVAAIRADLERGAGLLNTIPTSVRTELATELGRIDAAVSTRATPADVTAAIDTGLAPLVNPIGYPDNFVYVDTNDGAAGAVVGTNGTLTNPVDNAADAITLANAIGGKIRVGSATGTSALNTLDILDAGILVEGDSSNSGAFDTTYTGNANVFVAAQLHRVQLTVGAVFLNFRALRWDKVFLIANGTSILNASIFDSRVAMQPNGIRLEFSSLTNCALSRSGNATIGYSIEARLSNCYGDVTFAVNNSAASVLTIHNHAGDLEFIDAPGGASNADTIEIQGGAGNINLGADFKGTLNIYGRNRNAVTDNSGGTATVNFFDTRTDALVDANIISVAGGGVASIGDFQSGVSTPVITIE